MASETATHPLGRHTNGVWHRPEVRPINNWNGDFPPDTVLVNMFDREDLGYGPKWKAAQEAERLAAAAEVVEVAAGTAVAATVEKPETGTPAAANIVADGASVVPAGDVSTYVSAPLGAASFNAPAPVAAGAPAQ